MTESQESDEPTEPDEPTESEDDAPEDDPTDYEPTTDLPDATSVRPEPPPGGPDAVPGVGGDGAYSTVTHDPDPDHNPSTDESLPEETREPEDTDTRATRGEEEPDPGDEPPA